MQARLGELRVVPIVLSNKRRREREITIALGNFTTRGGKPAPVIAKLIGPQNFTMKACEEHTITVAIAVRDGQAPAAAMEAAFRDGHDGEVVDVDECVVAYGHLTVEGCDIRPVRIAVAILPRNCGAHRVECGCGCC